jgi:deazaflavin-dependent oxidoreductase (nitroreductase family)
MRKIALILVVPVGLGAAVAGARIWRRDPRVGTAFVNSVLNPALVRRGLAGSGRSEIATLEHVGRKSGLRRLTPVHPERTTNGFRIVVPLGMQSNWARNVLAAGHCRMQLHDQVFDLDEPVMVDVQDVTNVPWPLRRVMATLGFRYLTLHTFAAQPGAAARLAGESHEVETSGQHLPGPGHDVALAAVGRHLGGRPDRGGPLAHDPGSVANGAVQPRRLIGHWRTTTG